jgi:hypothetical protein
MPVLTVSQAGGLVSFSDIFWSLDTKKRNRIYTVKNLQIEMVHLINNICNYSALFSAINKKIA